MKIIIILILFSGYIMSLPSITEESNIFIIDLNNMKLNKYLHSLYYNPTIISNQSETKFALGYYYSKINLFSRNNNILSFEKSYPIGKLNFEDKKFQIICEAPLNNESDFKGSIKYKTNALGDFKLGYNKQIFPININIFKDYSITPQKQSIYLSFTSKQYRNTAISGELQNVSFQVENNSFSSVLSPSLKIESKLNNLILYLYYKNLIINKSLINLDSLYFTLNLNPSMQYNQISAFVGSKDVSASITFEKIKSISEYRYIDKYFNFLNYSTNFQGHYFINADIITVNAEYTFPISKYWRMKLDLRHYIINYYYNTLLKQSSIYGLINSVLISTISEVHNQHITYPHILLSYSKSNLLVSLNISTILPAFTGTKTTYENITLSNISELFKSEQGYNATNIPLNISLKVSFII